ncbi:MAG: cytochrome b N-terminal domain-containing protein [Thermodesulfobacteriota bacterium]
MEQKSGQQKDLEHRISLREILSWLSLVGFVYGPLDERLGIRQALEKALKKPVPHHVNWTFCFGGITFFMFLVLAVTGILLLMYYRPTTAEAYASVVYITNEVPFGWLIRGLHFWAGNLMIIMVILHMLRVFFYGAYKSPRDLNWIAGFVLFMLTLGFGFTGYLLPWNQISYWATTVGTEIPGAIPLVGDTLKYLTRGGAEVSQTTLTRFFAIHVVILPAIISFFLAVHFAVIRRQGISGPL